MVVTNESIMYVTFRFVTEVLEAMVLLYIVFMVNDKPVPWEKLVKKSLVLGAITTVTELFNEQYRRDIKGGIVMGIGRGLIGIGN